MCDRPYANASLFFLSGLSFDFVFHIFFFFLSVRNCSWHNKWILKSGRMRMCAKLFKNRVYKKRERKEEKIIPKRSRVLNHFLIHLMHVCPVDCFIIGFVTRGYFNQPPSTTYNVCVTKCINR